MVDVTGAVLVADLSKLPTPDPVVGRVRSGTPKPGVTRVVVDLKADVRPRTFTLKAGGEKGPRLVVDLYRKDILAQEKKAKPKPRNRNESVLVIDPGHGGKDPGSVGPNGVSEEDIVLTIAKELKKIIDERKEVKAVLTRDRDVFIPLRQRAEIADRANGKLFISNDDYNLIEGAFSTTDPWFQVHGDLYTEGNHTLYLNRTLPAVEDDYIELGNFVAGNGSLTLKVSDRKSTRLNSSHTVISYAVFCLKKKKDPN